MAGNLRGMYASHQMRVERKRSSPVELYRENRGRLLREQRERRKKILQTRRRQMDVQPVFQQSRKLQPAGWKGQIRASDRERIGTRVEIRVQLAAQGHTAIVGSHNQSRVRLQTAL